VRQLRMEDEEIELLLEVIEAACDAVATDYELLELEGASGEEDAEIEIDEEQADALEWIRRVLELREKIEGQSTLGGGSAEGD
jgi:hypothetical protein